MSRGWPGPRNLEGSFLGVCRAPNASPSHRHPALGLRSSGRRALPRATVARSREAPVARRHVSPPVLIHPCHHAGAVDARRCPRASRQVPRPTRRHLHVRHPARHRLPVAGREVRDGGGPRRACVARRSLPGLLVVPIFPARPLPQEAASLEVVCVSALARRLPAQGAPEGEAMDRDGSFGGLNPEGSREVGPVTLFAAGPAREAEDRYLEKRRHIVTWMGSWTSVAQRRSLTATCPTTRPTLSARSVMSTYIAQLAPTPAPEGRLGSLEDRDLAKRPRPAGQGGHVVRPTRGWLIRQDHVHARWGNRPWDASRHVRLAGRPSAPGRVRLIVRARLRLWAA